MASLGYTCFHCKSPIENGYRCFRCSCEKCGNYSRGGYCYWCELSTKKSLNDPQTSSNYPSQPEVHAINDKPSRFDPTLSQFTVMRNHAELRAVTETNDLPNLNVSREQEPEIITEVVEIPSSQSTPLVPPLDFSKCSSRLDSHSDHHVDFVDPIPSHNFQMESFIPCVGCGEPLFGSPCH